MQLTQTNGKPKIADIEPSLTERENQNARVLSKATATLKHRTLDALANRDFYGTVRVGVRVKGDTLELVEYSLDSTIKI